MAEPTELYTLRVSPAAHLADAMAASSAAPERIALREIPFALQIGLRAVPGTASARALEAVLGCALPARVGQVTGGPAGGHVLWLSPDEFLAVDVSRVQEPGAVTAFEAALEGIPGQALDLSANRTILELSGARALDVLEKGCRADLHPSVFPAGTAIVTSLGPVPVILHHVGADGEAGAFRIFPRASFADYTVRWLLDAMTEFSGIPLTAADFSGVGRREADLRVPAGAAAASGAGVAGTAVARTATAGTAAAGPAR